MAAIADSAGTDKPAKTRGALVYRQALATRVTHWLWAICLFFLLFTGLNIFNARPQLYWGQESGFAYDNTFFEIGSEQVNGQWRGYTQIHDWKFDTTGVFGLSGPETRPLRRAFPAWLTIPSGYNLATARVVHFFFGWLLVAVMFAWLVFSFFNGHLRRDVVLTPRDLAGLPKDIADHARLKLHHARRYSPLQKTAYFIVFFVLFPLIILTGLTMSPGMNTVWPWLVDVFGGRQSARSIHFIVMVLLVLFFVVHVVMVLMAGPLNELRSMITGWYRMSPGEQTEPGDRRRG